MEIVYTEKLFSLEQASDGTFFAIRESKPRFVLGAATFAEVCEKAFEAINFYEDLWHERSS